MEENRKSARPISSELRIWAFESIILLDYEDF